MIRGKRLKIGGHHSRSKINILKKTPSKYQQERDAGGNFHEGSIAVFVLTLNAVSAHLNPSYFRMLDS